MSDSLSDEMKLSTTKLNILIILSLLLILVGFACRDNPQTPYVPITYLSVEDVGVTECWLRVKFTKMAAYKMGFIIKRDERTILTTYSSLLDTMILDEGLLPKHSYTYKAYKLSNNTVTDSSTPLVVTTMDTTSHNFTWEIDTLGDGNSSALSDVFILNDTCVYVVGEIYRRDSLGRWNTDPYNFLKWDGKKWEMKSITYVPVRAIFAFSDNDIWVGTSAPYHWNGSTWRGYKVTGFNGYINKMWGTSSSNLYIVGTNGSIAYYNGTSWQKLESGTDVDLLDVYGSPDGSIVWACGWVDFKPTVVLRASKGICEKRFEELNPFTPREDSLAGILTSIWMPNDRRLFVLSGYGVYQCPITTHGEGSRIPFPPTWSGFPWRLRGNAVNDLFTVGEYYMLAHFNGMTLKHFEELEGYGRLVSVDQQNNFVIAVGYLFDPIHSRGIVFRGKR